MRFSRTLLAAVVALAALAVPGTAEAKRTVPRGWLGAVVTSPSMLGSDTLMTTETAKMTSVGVETLRFPVYWNDAQPWKREADVPSPQRPNYEVSHGVPTDFRMFDRVFAAAVKRRIKILPMVLGAPYWASAGNKGKEIASPKKTTDYTRFLTSLVERYGPSGTFWDEHPELPYRPQHTWQIWNEPDHPNFWKRPWVSGFVKLMKASRKTLKKLDKHSVVVMGALTGYSWYNLRRLYKAGIKGTYDVAAIHPYTAKPANVIKTLEYDRKVMRDYKDNKPIDVTELSWPASKGRVPKSRQVSFATSDKGQAKLLSQAVSLLAKNRKRLRIHAVYWFTWASSYATTNPWEYSGLRKLSGGTAASRPALSAFKRSAFRVEGRR
jgi:hypothetical protein